MIFTLELPVRLARLCQISTVVWSSPWKILLPLPFPSIGIKSALFSVDFPCPILHLTQFIFHSHYPFLNLHFIVIIPLLPPNNLLVLLSLPQPLLPRTPKWHKLPTLVIITVEHSIWQSQKSILNTGYNSIPCGDQTVIWSQVDYISHLLSSKMQWFILTGIDSHFQCGFDFPACKVLASANIQGFS